MYHFMHALDDATLALPRMLPVSSVTNWQKKFTCLPRKNNFYLQIYQTKQIIKRFCDFYQILERNFNEENFVIKLL